MNAVWLDDDDLAKEAATNLIASACRDVLCTWPIELDDTNPESTARCLLRVTRLVQALSSSGPRRPRLWFLTRGALRRTLNDRDAAGAGRSPAQAALWGLVRVLPVEQLGLWGGAIDLDPADAAAASLDRVFDIVAHEGREDQTAIRGSAVLAARLAPGPEIEPLADPFACRKDAAYLITGGFGGIGMGAARWLASRVPPTWCWSGDPRRHGMTRSMGSRRPECMSSVSLSTLPIRSPSRAGCPTAACRRPADRRDRSRRRRVARLRGGRSRSLDPRSRAGAESRRHVHARRSVCSWSARFLHRVLCLLSAAAGGRPGQLRRRERLHGRGGQSPPRRWRSRDRVNWGRGLTSALQRPNTAAAPMPGCSARHRTSVAGTRVDLPRSPDRLGPDWPRRDAG